MEKILNKKSYRDYEIIDKIEAGIILTGPEVKSIREGRIRLEDAYVKITENDIILINADIAPYKFSNDKNFDSKRIRKLLLNKKEILKLRTKMNAKGNLTIIPLACYNKKNIIKIEIGLARGKKNWEVKKVEQNRDEKRREEKEFKEYYKS